MWQWKKCPKTVDNPVIFPPNPQSFPNFIPQERWGAGTTAEKLAIIFTKK
jgi:hypothetical protein